MTIHVSAPRFEHHNPGTLGIGESRPRLSWRFTGDDLNWKQHAYELEITRNDRTTERVQNATAQSHLVAWPWRELRSHERARIRVRAQGPTGDWTAWSEVAAVEFGLSRPEDWGCLMIRPDASERAVPTDRPVVFVRSMPFPKGTPKAARLYVTAYGVYEARINGRRVGRDFLAPGWSSYRHRLLYQTYDVTDLLLSSEQSVEIAITVAEGWFCGRLGFGGGRRNIYGQSLALIASLYIELEDGSIVRSGTDEMWKWSHGPHLSSSIYDGEVYDARIPAPTVAKSSAVECVQLPSNLVAPDGPPVRETEQLPVSQILRSKFGKAIIDFAQNIAGWVRVTLRSETECTITFRYAEVLEDGELGRRPLRTALATDILTVKAGEQICWEPAFTYHGFRYVEVEGWPDEIASDAFRAIVVHTDMENTGTFVCSSTDLNQLHNNITWSMRSNFVSIPTDCPQRDERLGWTGDINMFSTTANYLYHTSGMLCSWMKDLVAEQLEGNGVVPLTVPNVVDGLQDEAHAIWGDVAVMLPWSLYSSYGDEAILRRHFHSMEAWLKAIPHRSDGLWSYSSDWKLGDWLDPSTPADDPGNSQTDPVFVANAFLVHVLSLMVKICAILNRPNDQAHYEAIYRQTFLAFHQEYISPSGRISPDTQTAYALAVSLSLYSSPEQTSKAAERLDWLIRRCSRFQITTGFAGTPLLGPAMTQVGLSSLFYRMLLDKRCPSWLYPITMGATTMWERWDSLLPDGKINPGEMTSFNHYALGSVGHWIHRTILGLQPVEPGWSVFAIKPIPGGGLEWAEGSFQSVYGLCHVRWEIRDKSEQQASAGHRIFWIRVEIPPNTTARVTLPGAERESTYGCGIHRWEVPFETEPWPPQAIIARYAPPDDFNSISGSHEFTTRS